MVELVDTKDLKSLPFGECRFESGRGHQFLTMKKLLVKNSGSFVFSSAILFFNFLYLIFFGYFFEINFFYCLYIFAITWIFLRFVDLSSLYLIESSKIIKDKSVIFSICYLLAFLVILLLGYARIQIDYFITFIIFFLDIFIILFFYKNFFLNYNKELLKITFLTSFLIFIISNFGLGVFPWMHLKSLSSLGYQDVFRDAALVNSYAFYNLDSYGIHGLMEINYHSLFAKFYYVFLKNDISIFLVFYIIGIIFVPTIIVYACKKFLYLNLTNFKIEYLYFFLFFFIFFISEIHIASNQRSFQIATLLYLPVTFLISKLWTESEIDIPSCIVLSFMLLVISYGRLFHGVVFTLTLLPFFIFRKKIEKAIIFIGISINTFFILNFYTLNERGSENVNIIHIFKGLGAYSDKFNYILSGTLISFISFACLIFLINKKSLSIKHVDKYRFSFFVIYNFFIYFFCSLIAKNETDIYYFAVPIAYTIFFFVINTNYINFLLNFIKINFKFFKNKKYLNFFVFFLFILMFVEKYSVSVIYDQLKVEYNDLKILSKNNIFQSRNDYYENIRNSPSYKISLEMNKLKKKLNGVTAVYVPPKNNFWNFRKKDLTALPLYFMAVHGTPMVYSILANSVSPKSAFWTSFNYSKIVEINGTISNYQELDLAGICKNINSVNVDNLIAFNDFDYKIEKIIKCN